MNSGIRTAVKEDLKTLFDLYVAMVKEAPFCEPNWKIFKYTWTEGFPPDASVIFLHEDENKKIDGFLAGFLFVHINAGTLMAMESIWYVTPEKRKTGTGRDLLSNFEKWARTHKAKYIFIARPFRKLNLNGKMSGYRSVETMFLKEL